MPYNIYLGIPQKRCEIHFFELEEKLHDHLFIKNQNFFKRYERLSRISDYYRNAIFFVDDIVVLLSEIETILEKSNDLQVKVFCHDMKKLCERATKEQKNIYCFCD